MVSLLLMSALTAAFTPDIFAQTGTSAIRGQVLDSQSCAVPSARVTITNEDSKRVRTQITGELGEFAFTAGFKKLMIEPVTAAVDLTADVPVHLEVGEVTQSVTVSTAQAALQMSDATLGDAFDENPIEQLPLNAETLSEFLQWSRA